jgi:hypothetical protein
MRNSLINVERLYRHDFIDRARCWVHYRLLRKNSTSCAGIRQRTCHTARQETHNLPAWAFEKFSPQMISKAFRFFAILSGRGSLGGNGVFFRNPRPQVNHPAALGAERTMGIPLPFHLFPADRTGNNH